VTRDCRAIRSGVTPEGGVLHWQGMVWDHASNYHEEDVRALICLCARHAAGPTGDPARASARVRRLHDLHVLGGRQHRRGLSVAPAGRVIAGRANRIRPAGLRQRFRLARRSASEPLDGASAGRHEARIHTMAR
jgi:hypothetical protein